MAILHTNEEYESAILAVTELENRYNFLTDIELHTLEVLNELIIDYDMRVYYIPHK